MKINLKAPAKINLFLEIKNKRRYGYHGLESVLQTVSLYDELSFEDSNDGIVLECDNKSLAVDETNIVYKAVKAVKECYRIYKGVKIYLKKEIPIAAGLGGGSSDAASTLEALVKLWNIKTTKKDISKIAVKLGSDVSFFLTGGTALCEGIGEIVTPLKSIENVNIVLVNPGFGISTAEACKKIVFPLTNKVKTNTIKSLICDGVFNNFKAFSSCFNRLEEFVITDYPEISKIKKILNNLGCMSLMSGSGSTVFGLFDFSVSKKKIKSELSKYSWKHWFVTPSCKTSEIVCL